MQYLEVKFNLNYGWKIEVMPVLMVMNSYPKGKYFIELAWRIKLPGHYYYLAFDGRPINGDRAAKVFEILWPELLGSVIEEAIRWILDNPPDGQ